MDSTTNTEILVYAGFWRRFAAMLIDYLILGALHMIVIVPVLGMLGIGAVASGIDAEGMSEDGPCCSWLFSAVRQSCM